MVRRLLLLATSVAVVLSPAMANAAVQPDAGYGSGGTSVIPTDCAPGTMQDERPQVGFGGRVYVLQDCAGGHFRLLSLRADGQVDTGYGVGGTVSMDVPLTCSGSDAYLRPAKDGSLYVVFARETLNQTNPNFLDTRMCLGRVTAGGGLVAGFGGTSAFRHLNRVGGGVNTFVDAARDSYGRLVVFTTRDHPNGAWRKSAVFVNRYTVSGKPDATFSGDGQRSFVQPGHVSGIWGGVYGAKPIVAINAYDGVAGGGFGTAFVRFTASGRLDKTFAGDGVRFVRASDVGGARTGFRQVALDGRGRVVFTEVLNAQKGSSGWCDVYRLSRSGATDKAFSAATVRMHGPTGSRVFYGFLQVSGYHYLVTWQLATRTTTSDRTTGFNADGSRWSALGTESSVADPKFAPDQPAFYRFTYTDTAGQPGLDADRFLVR